MRSLRVLVVPLIVLSSFTSALVPRALAGVLRDETPEPATVMTRLAAEPKDVHQALLEALVTWKMRKESLEEGIVKTEWVDRKKGDQLFRGRIVAEFRQDGYETVLTVKHEKERKAQDLVTSLGGPTANWQPVNGDHQIAQAVLISVQNALGQGTDPVNIGTKPASSNRAIEVWDCIVPADVANRINVLKAKRRDLVVEVKAMDQKILQAVYDGKLASMEAEVEQTKQRKAVMEQQITDIDKEILALVIAD